MNYYMINIFYENGPPLRRLRWSGHVIKTETKEEALLLQKKYGIANPMNADDILLVKCRRLKMNYSHNRRLIERRIRGIGGVIWYEENHTLKYECSNK